MYAFIKCKRLLFFREEEIWLHINHIEQLKQIIARLTEKCPNIFKFHGDVALNLFLHDDLIIEKTVTLCVNRKDLIKFLHFLPQNIEQKYYDYNQQCFTDINHLKLREIHNVHICLNSDILLNIYTYDVDKAHFIFEPNHNLRIQEQHMYFHSLKWDVDYIKPEIVLMYYFLDYRKQVDLSRYLNVIEHLSYFQFMTLQTVVGREKLSYVIKQNEQA